MSDLNRHRVSSCNHFFSVQPLCSLCLCGSLRSEINNHRDTENTEVALRRPLKTSTTLKLWRALFEKRSRAFLLVFGSSAKAKERSFESQALSLARLQTFIHCFE